MFFLIFFSIYAGINFYIFIHGWHVLPKNSNYRWVYLIVFIFISLAFIAAKFLERVYISTFTDIISWIGAFWFAAMIYFFAVILLIDILRAVNHFLPFFPDFMTQNPFKTKYITTLVSVAVVAIIVLAGFINTHHIRIKTLKLKVNKHVENRSTLNIVTIADLHLSVIVGSEKCEKIVNKINELKPDIVLMAGDIVDSDLDAVLEYNLGEPLKKIEAPLGVYTCTGNHEFIGGAEKAVKYLTDHNISVIRDSAILIDSSFYLVGREDPTGNRYGGNHRRKPLNELLTDIDKGLPIIVLDHQPLKLEEAAENSVDLQLSGHTHHGQLWPANLITNRIYEVSHGYKLKGDTHIYVSCGVGTWGPPVRLGSRPEIVNVILDF
ncbi:metallophosphoesterase [bacterium]|nr:metallophosphoesterase [bacterium]